MKQLIVRIDEETRMKMTRLARSEGKTSADVLRDLIHGYIRDRDISGYIDDLWERSGKKLRARRIGQAGMQRLIRQVRSDKNASRD